MKEDEPTIIGKPSDIRLCNCKMCFLNGIVGNHLRALSFFHWGHADLVISMATLGVVAFHLATLIGSAGLVNVFTVLAFVPLQFLLRNRLKVAAKRIQE